MHIQLNANKRLFPVIIVALCILSRLPQLLSSNLLLDGDECIVAIMARHTYLGIDFPLFFYGQAYGFTLLETLVISCFYGLVGVTTIAVKLAMLLLWTTGVLFMYKTFEHICDNESLIPLFAIIMFILCPAWAVWSMKARGGYLTSFLCSSVIVYYLLNRQRRSITMFCMLGILLVVSYESQPLWIPGLLPLLIYRLYTEKSIARWLAFLVPSLLLLAIFHQYCKGLSHFYHPTVFCFGWECIHNITLLPDMLYTSLHGNYYLWDSLNPNLFQSGLSAAFIICIFILLIATVYFLVKRKKDVMGFYISAASVICTLVATLFLTGTNYRYLLPISGYVMLSIVFLLQKLKPRMALVKPFFYFLTIWGTVGMITFKDFTFTPVREKNLRQMLAYLVSQNCHYVYSRSFVFTYMVDFYSNEEVICREYEFPGRYPLYTIKIDQALSQHQKTAFIGIDGLDASISGVDAVRVAGFFISFYPPEQEIRKIFIF